MKKKKITYKGKPIRISSDFSAETLQARKEWHDIFNAMKQKSLEPSILYPAWFSFKYDGGIKQFPDKQKLTEFASNKKTSTGYFKGTAVDGSTPKAKYMSAEKIKSQQRKQTNQILTEDKKIKTTTH